MDASSFNWFDLTSTIQFDIRFDYWISALFRLKHRKKWATVHRRVGRPAQVSSCDNHISWSNSLNLMQLTFHFPSTLSSVFIYKYSIHQWWPITRLFPIWLEALYNNFIPFLLTNPNLTLFKFDFLFRLINIMQSILVFFFTQVNVSTTKVKLRTVIWFFELFSWSSSQPSPPLQMSHFV